MKKFKLKNKRKIIFNIVLINILVITIIITMTSSFYMQKLSAENNLNSSSVIKADNPIKRSELIDEYIKQKEEKIVEEIDIKKEITSILIKENNKYESIIFNYKTGEAMEKSELINPDFKEDFENKIIELIYLKYPEFIAKIISKDNGKNEYFFKDNELIIYFYDYEIEPEVNEDLYLIVNYNEIYKYLNIKVDIDSKYENEDGFVINERKKLVAITFDDGPSIYTNQLVETLNKNKAHSTFFMLGNNLIKYKDAVLNVFNSGNEIGYHSYAHQNFKRQTLDEIKSEFEISNEYLKSITGTTFSLTRPPYGSLNEEIKESIDTSFILWNVDTEDWRHKDVTYLMNYVLEHIKAGDIILFHDIHKTSVETMEKLLPYLYVEGYQLVTVSALAKSYGTDLEIHKSYRYFSK